MKKKLLSIFLSLAMVVTMMPAMTLTAYAASNVAQIGDTDYATLEAAYASANAGDTITLLQDAEASAVGATDDHEKRNYGIIIRKSITLDLNNCTLSSSKYMAVWVHRGDVTIKNGTVKGSGTIALGVTKGANLTLDNVTVNYIGSKNPHRSLNAANDNYSLIIKGNTNLIGDFEIKSKNKSTSVEAGTYNFDPTAYVDSTKFWVDSSEASNKKWTVYTKVAVPEAKPDLVENDTEQTGVPEGEGYTLTGDFKATKAGNYTATATLEKDYVWADETRTGDRTINWSITAADTVARIGTTEYKTLAGALKAAKDGTNKTVTIVGTVKGFTFDGNYDGITIQGSKNGKITDNFTAAEGASLKNVKIKKLKFENCGIEFGAKGIHLENAVIQCCSFNGRGITGDRRQQAITINSDYADNLQIDKNTIKNYTTTNSSAILIGKVEKTAGFAEEYVVTISNNIIDNIAYNAIQAVGVPNLEITGNIISGAKKDKGPINVSQSAKVLISRNRITLAEGYAGVYYNIDAGIVTLDSNTIRNNRGKRLKFDENLANVDNDYDGVTDNGILVLKGATEATDRYIAVSKDVLTRAFPDKELKLVPGTKYT